MKRWMVLATCLLVAHAMSISAQEMKPQLPEWAKSATTGADAALVEAWYYKGFMDFGKPQKAKSLQQIALDELRYISTEAERRDLKKLIAPEDIGQFMTKFWSELDPSPGTLENEIQRDYYERFAYANENFGDVRPGWKTDQGRIYILYGPPDDIERNAWVNQNILGSGASIKAAETWLYTSSAGGSQLPNALLNYKRGMLKFLFADFEGRGEYQQIYSSEEGELSDPRLFARF